MKRIIGAAMLVAATPAAWAQDARSPAEEPRSYLSLSGGAIAGGSFGYDIPGGDVKIDTGTGYGITAALGRRFDSNLRGEVSLSYSEQDIDVVRRRGGPVILIYEPPGAVTSWSLDLTGYYDFTSAGNVRPYVGAGIGIASLDLNDRVIRDAGTAVKGKVVAGARWLTSSNTSLFLEGRYEALLMDIDDGDSFTGADSNVFMGSLGVYTGLRIGF